MSFLLKSLQKKRGIRPYIGPKRVILLLGLIAFVFGAWDYYRTGALSPTMIEQYRDNHPLGAVMLFILIYAISVITSMPSLPLNLAAGFFWGGLVGGVYSTLGVTIGGFCLALPRYRIEVSTGQPLFSCCPHQFRLPASAIRFKPLLPSNLVPTK